MIGQPHRGPLAALAFALGLWLWPAAASETAVRHRDWVASCPGDGDTLCVAETEARRGDGASRLRVTRGPGGRARALVIDTGARSLAENATLTLRVDGKAPLSIRHATAVGRSEAEGFRLLDAALVKKLVAQMKAGRRLTVSYRDSAGQSRSAEFSLMGLTASLRSHQRGAPGAGPQGPPDLYPPPEHDGKPEVQARAGDQGTVFTPAGEIPPVGGCYEHRRLHDDKGYFIGWSSRYRC